tara:strand:+ start:10447 stop:13008 length:2562 start_codon:yes stop_codon:yes gene_type:complete
LKKKIVITGALGYLGTELCRLYSGVSWNYKIVAIDKRFISERVAQLKSWNISFQQGDSLDKNFIKKHVFDADSVIHLAGVTDVAYTKNESNPKLNDEINKVAVEGTLNLLSSIKKNCRFIFPSTHVVFEGMSTVKKNITEDENPKPVLAYSKSKCQNELDIKKKSNNFIILRLGSVYGYSSDTMRLGIMPNLFSKIASQNGQIKLFAGGKQFKSLVSLIDVVRCFKFMEENKKIKNQIFHLSKETVTVKDVALICKKINPKLEIIETKDEIPNLGYTISNKKLLKTGFRFLYNLKEAIKDMIEKWKFVENKNNLEHIFYGENEFVDKRGKINNFELTEPINLIGHITSKKGTVRANHYHPVQEQKCLVTNGQFISVYQDLLNQDAKKITHVVNEGELIVTKPNVAHSMVFSKDTEFLNLVRGEREHKNYGITHTIPSKIVNEDERKILLKNYKFTCRSCNKSKFKRVLSLGFQPLANNLIKSHKSKIKKYPLEVNFCTNCCNVQLSVSIDPKQMFSNYLYLSSASNSLVKHFEHASIKYVKLLKLNRSSQILDIGSNDGSGLIPFKKLGFKNLYAVEPAKNLAKITKNYKIKTFNEFFSKNTVKKIRKKMDLILLSNVFAHSDNLKSIVQNLEKILSKKGTVIIEVQYLLKTMKDLTFDNIYHEHYNYWTLTSLLYFFRNSSLTIFKAEEINTHGGSLRIFLSSNINKKQDKSIRLLLNNEKKFGIQDFKTYLRFGNNVNHLKENVIKNIKNLKNKYQKLVGYGSPAKATTLLNFYNLDSSFIDFTIEDNALKQGKLIPGVNIPIKKPINRKIKNSVLIVLAWNYFNEIKNKNKKYFNKIISIKDLEKEKLNI